jgi:protein-glutamine gamma-glutamyltransferase
VNASAATLERASRRRAGGRTLERIAPARTARVLAFCGLALLAGARFASLLTHPPLARVLGVVAASGACAAALAALPRSSHGRAVRTALAVAIVAASGIAALLAAGVPAHLMWPWHWARAWHTISAGLSSLDGRWPYDGGAPHARLAVMLALPVTIVPAAALAFWPVASASARARVTGLSLLLALYTTAAINESRAGWQVQGTLLLALLCAWGWAWSPRALEPVPALASVVAIGVAALVLAGVLESPAALLDYRAWNPFGTVFAPTRFDWNQTYGPRSWPRSGETMVEVASPAPHLWRATTLDHFDGVRFERSIGVGRADGGLPGVVVDPFFLQRTSFVLRGLAGTELLSPGEILAAVIAGRGLSHLRPISPDGTVALSGASATSGDHYTVTSYVPQPGTAAERLAPRSFPAVYAPYTEFDLPPDAHSHAPVTVTGADAARIEASPYARVFRLARRLALGARSSYDVIARVQGFLRHGFTYDENAPRTTYPLVTFLLTQHRGYCQQFSGAMALLLRMDGIPARVAAGFLPGTLDRTTGLYRVSASDAHAWVEAYFAGIGWVPFDPTPPAPVSATTRSAGAVESAAEVRHRFAPLSARRRGRAGAARAAARTHSGETGTLALGLVLALAVLLGAAWALGSVRLRRAFSGDAAGAAREVTRAFATVGRPLAPGMTLAALERELGPRAGEYVRILRQRRFAACAGTPIPSARDRRRLRRALRPGRSPRAWALALLALPPGSMPRADASTR